MKKPCIEPCMINIIPADFLSTFAVRTSAGMILTIHASNYIYSKTCITQEIIVK